MDRDDFILYLMAFCDVSREEAECIEKLLADKDLIGENSPEKKTLQEWARQDGLKILDPDGFDRSDPQLMEKLFTKEEYLKGLWLCTVAPLDWE